MKYIPTEKLIAEIKRLDKENKELLKDGGSIGREFLFGIGAGYADIIKIVTSLQQEQPEVDLEKFTEKIKTFQGRYKHPENISVKGAMAFMARMFYQYPNTARQWYDSLPKATMDDARKEEFERYY